MIEIASPLTPAEVLARLRQRVGQDLWFLNVARSHPNRPLSGWVRETEFAIRLRTAAGILSTLCRGTVESTSAGSVIRVRLQPQQPLGPVVRALAGLMLLGGAILIARGEAPAAALGWTLTSAVLFIALVRALSAREERTLLHHLRSVAQVGNR